MAASGTSYSAHLKTMSTFMLQWSPDDGQIGNAVSILSRRKDGIARSLTAEYLQTLPWGVDRAASVALVEGLSSLESDQSRQLLLNALELHTTASTFRLKLLSHYAQYDLIGSPGMALTDLRGLGAEPQQIEYLDWCWEASDQVNRSHLKLPPGIQSAISAIDVGNWSSASHTEQ